MNLPGGGLFFMSSHSLPSAISDCVNLRTHAIKQAHTHACVQALSVLAVPAAAHAPLPAAEEQPPANTQHLTTVAMRGTDAGGWRHASVQRHPPVAVARKARPACTQHQHQHQHQPHCPSTNPKRGPLAGGPPPSSGTHQ